MSWWDWMRRAESEDWLFSGASCGAMTSAWSNGAEMVWNGDLREMVLHEFRESARLKGAKTPGAEDVQVGEREAEVVRVKRRIVGRTQP